MKDRAIFVPPRPSPEAGHRARIVSSLHDEGADSGVMKINCLDSGYDFDEEIGRAEDLQLLRRAMVSLDPHLRRIVERRYAGETLEAIAADYRCTKEWVRQQQVRGLKWLAKYMMKRDKSKEIAA